MSLKREYLDGLARLHLTVDGEERRALWRQSMATLAGEASEQRPVPLEGLDPRAVLLSTRVAIAVGLLDDLDFLAPAASAAALYELAAVLPMGQERRELGRRVAQRLHKGAAPTFVALATRLALGSKRGLSGPGIRARVALALDLPIGTGTHADALALALVSRRELAREWLTEPSTGSLPSRRMAARLLERAAREAARRCALGDGSILSVFERGSVADAWSRLLSDREPLVWRHVATARGLLSAVAPQLAMEIRSQLDTTLTPTEWRRAAASLAASIAVTPARSLEASLKLIETRVLQQDRGLPGAMLLGVPRAAEVEPEAADELCAALVRVGGIQAAEALLALRHERVGGEFGVWACQMARAELREAGAIDSDDDGVVALASALDEELRPEDERNARPTLRMHLDGALAKFAEEGAEAAYGRAHAVLHEVEATLRRLESAPQHLPTGRRDAYLALRELDGALLETSTLSDLLTLGSRSNGDTAASGPLDTFFARLTDWLLHQERAPIENGESIEHTSLRLNRLVTLLHVVDADGSWGEGRSETLTARRLKTVRALLERVRDDQPSVLRRVLTAAAARACDALLREDVGELSDIFILAIQHVDTVEGLTTMAEASMVPEMKDVFRAYATLVARTQREVRTTDTRGRASLDALRTLIESFPTAASPRVNALHGALLAFSRAVEAVRGARSLAELAGEADERGSRIMQLEAATRLLARLVVGARRRLGDTPEDTVGVAGAALRLVDIAIERAYRGDTRSLGESLASGIDALHEDLPTHLAEVAGGALVRAVQVPREASPDDPRDSFLPLAPKESPLPPWLPPSRTLGGFYVLRALGAGAVGSVFVALRSEEKKDEGASRFALKVPEYGGAVSRTLSEEEFLRLFREEAGALLAIPEHDNLARLVTFDAGARPKPILVMELVEGPTLERVIHTGALDVSQVFALLDGIAAGLDSMHTVGVGHLDLKPSNVILRDLDVLTGHPGTPVLVDFGLAGRNLRPGCATANYGAPEVWGLTPKGHKAVPATADIYAFGCLAFEILTGRELVHGSSEVAIITSHLSHDGDFEGLRWLAQDPELEPITRVLGGAVRQDPRSRTPIRDLRAQLAAIAPMLAEYRWPLTNEAAA